MIRFIPILFILTSCVELGQQVRAENGVGDCFTYEGKSEIYKITEITNKNYKYLNTENQSDGIYPIVIVDRSAQVVPCPN